MQPHPFFPVILCVELLVLIAGIFLMAYIAKQQLSKWFTYGSAAIVVFTLLLMTCTCCMVCCMRHSEEGKMRGECGMEERFHHRMMMEHMQGRECMEGRCEREKGECCGEERRECCEMKKEHCEKEEGEEGKECCKKGEEKKQCEMKEKEEMGKKEVKEEKKK